MIEERPVSEDVESIRVATPLRNVLGSSGTDVKRALGWHVVHGLARMVPLLVVALMVGEIAVGTLTTQFVWWSFAVIVASLLLAFVAANRGNRFLYAGAFGVGADLRMRLVTKIRTAPVGDVLSIPRGEIATVIDRDVSDVEDFLNSVLSRLTSATIAPMFLVASIAFIDLAVGAALILSILVFVAGYRKKLRSQAHQSNVLRRLRGTQDERIVEFVQGIEVAKAFGLRGEIASRLSQSLRDYKDENLREIRHIIPIGAALKAGASMVGGLLLAVGGWRYAQGAMDSREVATLLLLSAGTTLALLQIGKATVALPATSAALRRIEQILGMPNAPSPSGGSIPKSFGVHFESVQFAYDASKRTLEDITFSAPAGLVTAIIGRSGAGKTTVLHLLAGLWQPDAGRITIGGIDLATLSHAQRSQILTIVLQDPYLPDGTIRDVIAGDRSVLDTEIEAAAKSARCWELIQGLPAGLDTMVGEGGKRMSGGERQRIAIARALIADTPVVCLDEATAALDATTERALQEAMAALLRDRTVLVVAHRPQTIRAADHIVVIKDGRVAESGTHRELIAAGGVYSQRTEALEASNRKGFGRE